MRKILIAFLVLVCLSMAQTAVAAEGVKIAVVDVQMLMTQSKAGKSMASQIKDKTDSYKIKYEAKAKELQAAQNDLISKKSTLSKEEFAQKRQDLEKKYVDYQREFQQSRQNIDQAIVKTGDVIRQKIEEITQKTASEKSYDLILPTQAVIVAKKESNITTDIMTQLDAVLPAVKVVFK
jgi:outer membrane protein